MKSTLGIVLLSAIVGTTGCARPTMQSGVFEVDEAYFTESVIRIAPRAEFELDCPAERIDYVVVAVSPVLSREPTQIGASGCGRRVVIGIRHG